MLGRVHVVGTKSPFPPGYRYKTGILSLSECNNNPSIIPLTLKTRGIKTADSGGFNVMAGKVVLADVAYVGGAWMNNQRTNIYVDFVSAFGFDYDKLIAGCKPVSVNAASIYSGDITSWLEKVGA